MGEGTPLPDYRRNGRNDTVSQITRNGKFYSPLSPLERFAEKCRFDPVTGCVLWIGGTSAGHGNSTFYGRFKHDGHNYYAHRWSAENIHGLDIDGVTVGHCCQDFRPGPPNSLCVQHVKSESLAANIAERNTRVAAKARQSAQQRQFWLFVSLGIEPAPEVGNGEIDGIPFFDPPEWFKPFVPKIIDCPF